MHYSKYVRLLLLLCGIGGIFSACYKNKFEGADLDEHSSDYAFPLFSTTLQLSDLLVTLLNDTLSGDTIVINPDQTMTLYYSGDLAEKKATDIFTFFENGLVPVADTLFYAPFKAPDGVTIREADLSGGKMNVIINNPFPETIHGTFYIPQMVKNGVPYSFPFSIPPGFPIPLISPDILLDGYVLKSDNNTLFFRYEAYLPNGDRVKIPEIQPGTPGVGISFIGLKFSYLEGYWGYSEYPLTRDTIEIDINQTNLTGNVIVKDPKVRMTIYNSWGFPTRGVVKYLSFIGQNGEEYKLESTILANGDSLDFNYPSLTAGEVGQTKETYFDFNSSNSNIATIFNSQPTRLIYDVLGISNAQKDSTLIGFLTDSSSIKLGVSVELLLEGSVKDFGAEQYVDVDFGDYNKLDTENLESIEFKMATENTTPVAVAMQLYFLDEAGNTIDSLFVGELPFIMEAAPIDGNGNVTGSKRTETFVPMSVERFDQVRQAKKLYLKTYFTTAEGGQVPVKLLATQAAIVKLGLKVRTRL